MKHFLHALVLDRNPRLSISEETYADIKAARGILTAAFSLEESYDLVLANYRELEISALRASVDEMTGWRSSYEDFFNTRSELNRRALNLLSATRLYLDQYRQRLSQVGVDAGALEERRKTIHSDFFEYRFMEALRNHVQHAGLAVHGVEVNSSWKPKRQWDRLEFRVTPYAMKASLELDPKFKKSVLAECPEKVPIIPAARKYVEGISVIHAEARKLVDPIANRARSKIEAAIAQHEHEAKQRYVGLAAVAEEAGQVVEKVPVLLDWDDVRIKLNEQNRALTNLSQRHVSSQSQNEN